MITLTSDFGDSHYVGAMKGAILRVHPEARLVDITHRVPPQDVRQGAFALAAAAPHFPDGTVHVAVVDPGVGTQRRPILAVCERGLLVGPDNGLLLPAARRLGLVEVRELANRALWRKQVSATFHGRDVFGPVAAHLDKGVAPATVGPALKEAHPLDLGAGRREGRDLVGEVVLIDGFGNVVLGIGEEMAREALREGQELVVAWAGGEVPARFVSTYGDGAPGETLVLVGSAGFLEVALHEGSFAAASGIEAGMAVRVRG